MGQRLFETFYSVKVFSKIMKAEKLKNPKNTLTLGIRIVLWLITVVMVFRWVEPVRN